MSAIVEVELANINSRCAIASPQIRPRTLPASSRSTRFLGLNDSQLNPEFQEAREAIPLALFDFLVERKDAGQMINVDNIKNMPTINELQTRCNPIYFIKQEGHGRYGFLENIQDEDIVDTNEPDT